VIFFPGVLNLSIDGSSLQERSASRVQSYLYKSWEQNLGKIMKPENIMGNENFRKI